MRRSLIVAVSENGVIGADGKIPWHLSSDLRRFKSLTMGHHLIMGRKTYESIGQPLPGRKTIVLTHDPETFLAKRPGPVCAAGGLSLAFKIAEKSGGDEVFVCGGAKVYADALALCDRMYCTVVERTFDGDTYFLYPFRNVGWRRVEVTHVEGEELPHRFEIWER